jgi:hypothetical protein
MAEISILSEHEIETYATPDKKVKQRVITYQVEGRAPRNVWVDSDKLPDVAYQVKNPGKKVPVDIQVNGDKVRRAAIETDIAKLNATPQPRKI